MPNNAPAQAAPANAGAEEESTGSKVWSVVRVSAGHTPRPSTGHLGLGSAAASGVEELADMCAVLANHPVLCRHAARCAVSTTLAPVSRLLTPSFGHFSFDCSHEILGREQAATAGAGRTGSNTGVPTRFRTTGPSRRRSQCAGYPHACCPSMAPRAPACDACTPINISDRRRLL